MFGGPGGLGRRMEARRPELRHRGGGAPGPGSSAVGPGYSGSRCFMGISLGLALVEGLPAAGWATWVDVRSAQWNAGAGKTAGPTA